MSDNLSFLLTCAAECLNNWGYDGHGKHVDDGVKEITRLRAENEKLSKDVAEFVNKYDADVFALRAENEKLRKALKPFAYYASQIPDDVSDTASASGTVGDLRAAASAIRDTE